MAKTSLVYTLDIKRDSCYYINEAEDEPTSPTSDQPLDYGKELINMQNIIEAKVCSKCGEDKPFSEYSKKKQSKDGHRNDCKACVSEYMKARHEANREREIAKSKAYYEANRERDLANKRAHYKANRDEVLSRNRAYYGTKRSEILSQKRGYYEMNKDDFLARNTRRKRLIAGAKQEPYLREDIFEQDNWTCQLCQEPINPELKWPESGSASIDHIIPLSLGGDDTPANVQAAHLSCNQGKGNRVELEDLQAA